MAEHQARFGLQAGLSLARSQIVSRGQARGRSSGYTLLELVVVLAIMSTLAAMAFPVLMRPLAKSRVQQAAQDLSRIVLSARLRSMETGREHRLRWRPGTGEFELTEVPDASDDRLAGPSPLQSSQPNEDASRLVAEPAGPDRLLDRLPADVIFKLDRPQPQTDPLTRIATTLAEQQPTKGATPPPQLPWSQAVSFYPDGGTSTAKWTLSSPDGFMVDLMLRGLTGTVQLSTVRLDPHATGSNPAEIASQSPSGPVNDAPAAGSPSPLTSLPREFPR